MSNTEYWAICPRCQKTTRYRFKAKGDWHTCRGCGARAQWEYGSWTWFTAFQTAPQQNNPEVTDADPNENTFYPF